MDYSYAPEPQDRTLVGAAAASDASSRGLRAGMIISNRYQIGSLLGSGGMGLVYEAEHLMLATQVAIKVLRPELSEHPEHPARFVNEARFLAELHGEHVVRVLDAGRLETGLPFYAMERLHGLNLRSVLRECQQLPVQVALDYAWQASTGLAEAHALGMIHGDIKPSNLFLASDPLGRSKIKVLDFGVALRESDPNVAADAERLGSPSYASPEQLDALESVDSRTDVWSLGVVLFEMLTGQLPYEDQTGRLPRAAVGARLRLLRERQDIDAVLIAVVERCLSRRKADRFASAGELRAALERASGRQGQDAREAVAARRSEQRLRDPFSRFASGGALRGAPRLELAPRARARAPLRWPWPRGEALTMAERRAVGR